MAEDGSLADDRPSHPFDDDKLREECGVFGVYGTSEAAALTALGLHALQHRGQEAAGIVAFDGEIFKTHRALGHVGDNFNSEDVISKLNGCSAIGHVRYSTAGDPVLRNVQPLFADLESGGFAICHNGNLTNAIALRKALVKRGSLFQSTTDTEAIVHLMATSARNDAIGRLIDALRQVEGAYSLAALADDMVIGVRDPLGIRPLVIGKYGASLILASETCALDIIGAEFVRDVEPGELVVLDASGVHSMQPFPDRARRFCIFEYVYFARPDSVVEGANVYEARVRIGEELAKESAIDADLVIPVPDSGVPAAIGFARQSNLDFGLGIIRNHYVGRTFIEPTDKIRHLGVKLKHNANSGLVGGKRIVLVDDSIVRGTTSIKIVEMMRRAGALEVHMRIASPPTVSPCFYGVDTPKREKLLAHNYDLEAMRAHIGADSLAFISIDGLYRAVGQPSRNADAPHYCDACFTNDYPVAPSDRENDPKPRQLSLLAEMA